MNFARRLAKLETTAASMRDNRLILRFEGPDSERMPQPTAEDLASGTEILTVVFVAAKDGRPA